MLVNIMYIAEVRVYNRNESTQLKNTPTIATKKNKKKKIFCQK